MYNRLKTIQNKSITPVNPMPAQTKKKRLSTNRSGLTEDQLRKKFDTAKLALLGNDTNMGVLVELDVEVLLSFIAILSKLNYLMLGPSGEGKTFTAESVFSCFSDDVTKMVRQVNAQTKESQLFGIPPHSEMSEGSMRRNLQGTMAACELIYIDELGKANPSLLTVLMRLANEKQVDNFDEMVDALLHCMIASSNEPPNKNVIGFPQRFPLKNNVKRVSWDGRRRYVKAIQSGGRKTVADSCKISIDQLMDAQDIVQVMTLPDSMIDAAAHIGGIIDGSMTKTNTNATTGPTKSGICSIDTRKWAWAMTVLKANVFLSGRKPEYSHLSVLQHVFWDEPKHARAVAETVNDYIQTKTKRLTDVTFK